MTTFSFEFYSRLHYFLNQNQSFPRVAHELKINFESAIEEISLPRENFEELLHIFSNHHSSLRPRLVGELVGLVFIDLVCKFQDQKSLDLFAKYLILADQENHLYVMYSKPDPKFPLQIKIVASNRKLFMEHNRTLSGNTIHVYFQE